MDTQFRYFRIALIVAFLMFPLGAVHGSIRGGMDSTPLTFEERVHFQRAIEQVYWNHSIWPKENKDPKPELDAVLPDTNLNHRRSGRSHLPYGHLDRLTNDYLGRPPRRLSEHGRPV